MEDLLALLDPADPQTRIDDSLARAEFASRMLARDSADLWATIDRVLRDAHDHPDAWVKIAPGKDGPTAREFAVRSAAADLALRLRLSENTIRNYGHLASVLRSHTPRCWAALCDGELSPASARAIVDAIAPLDRAAALRVDEAVVERAKALPVARLREVVRLLVEREQPDPAARHVAAAEGRGVWVDSVANGMAWLSVLLPEVAARRALAHLDGAAVHLATAGGETRTIPQLRADIAADLLTGAGTPWEVGVDVAVTVPVLTLLGESDESGVLEGRFPVDPETARRLAGGSKEFTRILTHPIHGTVLDVDRDRYSPPAGLRRWVHVRDGLCRFPGCGKSALRCDLDHTVDWGGGREGPTSAANLAAVCRAHHRLKHETRWTATGTNGRLTWTSPTDYRADSDPPPF